jgi:hypothetical protein
VHFNLFYPTAQAAEFQTIGIDYKHLKELLNLGKMADIWQTFDRHSSSFRNSSTFTRRLRLCEYNHHYLYINEL